jgi:hypothetical protein
MNPGLPPKTLLTALPSTSLALTAAAAQKPIRVTHERPRFNGLINRLPIQINFGLIIAAGGRSFTALV